MEAQSIKLYNPENYTRPKAPRNGFSAPVNGSLALQLQSQPLSQSRTNKDNLKNHSTTFATERNYAPLFNPDQIEIGRTASPEYILPTEDEDIARAGREAPKGSATATEKTGKLEKPDSNERNRTRENGDGDGPNGKKPSVVEQPQTSSKSNSWIGLALGALGAIVATGVSIYKEEDWGKFGLLGKYIFAPIAIALTLLATGKAISASDSNGSISSDESQSY